MSVGIVGLDPTASNTASGYTSRPHEYADMREFCLYWSSLAKYENCPQSFLWYKGWKDIDLGRGPGRGKAIPERRSEHHAMMGDVIQGAIEDLYNEELWRDFRGADLRKKMDDLTLEHFNKQSDRRYVEYGNRWDQADSSTALLQTCLEGVRGYLRTMKHNRLLGVYSRCEVDFKGRIDEMTYIGGRADFVIRRQETREVNPGITILDGKNSKSKGKYTDPDQVRFYALLMLLDQGIMPDRIGFVYFRYPYGTPVEGGEPGEVESGIDWIPFDKGDLDGLAHRAQEARRGMEREEFDPTPTPKGCKFCDFESVCEARQKQIAKNRRGRKSSKTKVKVTKMDRDLTKSQGGETDEDRAIFDFRISGG